MAAPTYDLVRGNYVLSKPLEAARFQRTSLDFMRAVRDNAFIGSKEGVQLMDDFCAFVSSKRVWHLAQNVVPEFRSAPGPSDGNPEHHCLGYILHRSKLPLLPAPRDDKNVLTSEEKMVRDRHRAYVEYLVTGGKGISRASPSDRVAIDSLCEQFEGVHEAATQSAKDAARQHAGMS